MSKLVYITNTSLDGYIEDATGAFDWVDPAGVFEFITEFVTSSLAPLSSAVGNRHSGPARLDVSIS